MTKREKIDDFKQQLGVAARSCMANSRTKRRMPREKEVREQLVKDAVSAGLISPFLVVLIAFVKPLLWAAIVELTKEILDKLREQLDEVQPSVNSEMVDGGWAVEDKR